MPKKKVFSKLRGALPNQVCKLLGIKAGGAKTLERRAGNDRNVWVHTFPKQPERPRLGRLRAYAIGKGHGMDTIRENVARSRQAGGG